jgi:hypothetical protein
MKTIIRFVLLVLAGLSLAGCSTKTTAQKENPAPRAAALGDQPLSGRDYWLSRDFDDRIDRAISSSTASTSPRR